MCLLKLGNVLRGEEGGVGGEGGKVGVEKKVTVGLHVKIWFCFTVHSKTNGNRGVQEWAP